MVGFWWELSYWLWIAISCLCSHMEWLPWWLSGKEYSCQCRRLRRHRFDPWVGKIRREGNGNPLQYSCRDNTMDRGAWWGTAVGLHSLTQLSALAMHVEWREAERSLVSPHKGTNLIMSAQHLWPHLTLITSQRSYVQIPLHLQFRASVDVRVGPQRRLRAEELMLSNCSAGDDSWESLGLQEDQISQS